MNVTFACPDCERPARLALPSPAWQCPACTHRLESLVPDASLSSCPLCGNGDLYKKKDFPHWLGLTILTVACLGFTAGQAFYLPWLAWGVLIGSALVDGLLYVFVGDVVVCYRCGGHYRGSVAGAHQPHELAIAERYRQERLRREELKRQ